MSDFFASSASRSTLRFCTSSAYSFAASIFIAVSRFWCWLRPVWQATPVLVGMWVMRTADSVLLTCWPPAPEDRYTAVRRTAGLLSNSMLSPTSGEIGRESCRVIVCHYFDISEVAVSLDSIGQIFARLIVEV